MFLRLFVIAFPRNPAYASARFVTFVLAWACFMKVTMFYLMYMGVLVFVLVANRYDGCFNGYDYDCCKNRLSDRFYPSLVKPFPYYYRCVNRRVVYGRCGANRCVTESGSCGESDETLMSTFVYRCFEYVNYMSIMITWCVTLFYILSCIILAFISLNRNNIGCVHSLLRSTIYFV